MANDYKKGLDKALEIKSSKYKTSVHASPHKADIDNWIIEKRWSSRAIANELNSKYPTEVHPSFMAIVNYRRRYIEQNTEVGSVMRSSGDGSLYEKLINLSEDYYNFANDLMKLNKDSYKRVLNGAKKETEGIMPIRLQTMIVRDYVEVSKLLVVVMQTIGVPRPPEEVEVDLELEKRNKNIDVRKELDRIERVVKNSARRGIQIPLG